jgi:hypothetical protein
MPWRPALGHPEWSAPHLRRRRIPGFLPGQNLLEQSRNVEKMDFIPLAASILGFSLCSLIVSGVPRELGQQLAVIEKPIEHLKRIL